SRKTARRNRSSFLLRSWRQGRAWRGEVHRLVGQGEPSPSARSKDIKDCKDCKDRKDRKDPGFSVLAVLAVLWVLSSFGSEGDQPQPDGLHDRLAAALDAQLAEDGVDVELDRVVADAQPLGDPLVGEPLAEELEHLDLPWREALDEVRRGWGSV